ncbi:MAG TPA: hypothetical protein VH599_14965 [Ktedonobacterales bacterium]|jgi:hypothetical protein
MEQVIFLHADEDNEDALSQIQQSLAQRLILVAPIQMDRLRLSLLLRLARRQVIAQARQLYLISEDRLAQMLATRLGYRVASTLDEYRGLTPHPSSSFRKYPRQAAPILPLAGSRPPTPPPAWPRTLPSEAALVDPSEPPPPPQRKKPSANLEKMLEDGYLPNPAAIPDLDEEEERAEREEPERLRYEIADENHPSQAQQEAEQHEEQIIARILRTSRLGAAPPAPPAPESQTDQSQGSPPPTQTANDATQEEDPPPEPPATDSGTSGSSASQPAKPPAHPADQASAAPHPPEKETPGAEPRREGQDNGLPSLRTIDELLLERGRRTVFDWFERQAAAATAAISSRANSVGTARSAAETPARTSIGAEAPAPATLWVKPAGAGGQLRQPWRLAQALRPSHSGSRLQLRPPGVLAWRRIGVISVLALSLLMLGAGSALIPSAEVRYHEEITPYSEILVLGARPGVADQPAGAQHLASAAPAEIARFDGVLTAQVPATGLRNLPDTPDHPIFYPTQADIDEATSQLQAQLQQWGETTLRAQQEPGDILGPAFSETETLVFPPAGTNLPAGVSHFQVALALHLHATLLHHQALLQAVQNRLRQDVSQRKPGFAPLPGQAPKMTILSVGPAGPGDAQLELLVRVQARAMIGPALTPEQARSAISGLAMSAAEAYLNGQPGITHVSISVQPKWLNRLPIFSARITINLES